MTMIRPPACSGDGELVLSIGQGHGGRVLATIVVWL
jgi:hypothetical protein